MAFFLRSFQQNAGLRAKNRPTVGTQTVKDQQQRKIGKRKGKTCRLRANGDQTIEKNLPECYNSPHLPAFLEDAKKLLVALERFANE